MALQRIDFWLTARAAHVELLHASLAGNRGREAPHSIDNQAEAISTV